MSQTEHVAELIRRMREKKPLKELSPNSKKERLIYDMMGRKSLRKWKSERDSDLLKTETLEVADEDER